MNTFLVLKNNKTDVTDSFARLHNWGEINSDYAGQAVYLWKL